MLQLTDNEWSVLRRAVVHYRSLAADFDNDVDFADLLSIEEKLNLFRTRKRCPACKGDGNGGNYACDICGGTGLVER